MFYSFVIKVINVINYWSGVENTNLFIKWPLPAFMMVFINWLPDAAREKVNYRSSITLLNGKKYMKSFRI
jgi:hypothetical protein